MNWFTRLSNWWFGRPNVPYRKRMTIDGIGLECIIVYAKGREAIMEEMLMVIGDSRYTIEGGKNSGFRSSTEEWNQHDGETDRASIHRIAGAVGASNPGLYVIAFAWPDTIPTLIVAIVTESPYTPPFELPKEKSATAFQAATS